MTTSKLHDEILKALRSRKDIWLDDVSLEAIADGSPAIRGIQLRRAKQSETRGADGYHPYHYVGWLYYGQAFAVETEFRNTKSPLTKAQLDWMDDFSVAGGLYIEARNIDDALARSALGHSEPQPWADYENRVTTIKMQDR